METKICCTYSSCTNLKQILNFSYFLSEKISLFNLRNRRHFFKINLLYCNFLKMFTLIFKKISKLLKALPSYHKQHPLRKKCPYAVYSGPYFPAFGLNTERYFVSLRIQSECGKIWTRITPNTDNFHAVIKMKSIKYIVTPMIEFFPQIASNFIS